MLFPLISHTWAKMFGTLGVGWLATLGIVNLADPLATAIACAILLWIPNLIGGFTLTYVYGTMGGEGQPQTQAALVTRMVDFGYDVQQALEAPRWLMGRMWGVESRDLLLEGRISDEVVRELKRRGPPVRMVTSWATNMGHAQAIRIDEQTGFREGGADPRGDGSAVGF